jgi:hypothetical protein
MPSQPQLLVAAQPDLEGDRAADAAGSLLARLDGLAT